MPERRLSDMSSASSSSSDAAGSDKSVDPQERSELLRLMDQVSDSTSSASGDQDGSAAPDSAGSASDDDDSDHSDASHEASSAARSASRSGSSSSAGSRSRSSSPSHARSPSPPALRSPSASPGSQARSPSPAGPPTASPARLSPTQKSPSRGTNRGRTPSARGPATSARGPSHSPAPKPKPRVAWGGRERRGRVQRAVAAAWPSMTPPPPPPSEELLLRKVSSAVSAELEQAHPPEYGICYPKLLEACKPGNAPGSRAPSPGPGARPAKTRAAKAAARRCWSPEAAQAHAAIAPGHASVARRRLKTHLQTSAAMDLAGWSAYKVTAVHSRAAVQPRPASAGVPLPGRGRVSRVGPGRTGVGPLDLALGTHRRPPAATLRYDPTETSESSGLQRHEQQQREVTLIL